MKDCSTFLHQLYSPGGAQGLAALKNAPKTHPNEWANRNPYTMVALLKHSWSGDLPNLGAWVVENIPSPTSNFPSLLSESIRYENAVVTDFLLKQFEEFTAQNVDAQKAQRIGLSAIRTAAEQGELEYLIRINHIMNTCFSHEQFDEIAAHGAAHTNIVQHLWNKLSEPGKIYVASMVVFAANSDCIKWVAHQIPSVHWVDVEYNLDGAKKTLWREHTSVVQRARLEEHTQPTAFRAPHKKI